MLVVGLIKQYI